ncbi:odorant receptor 131-2-like [Sphaeramia orbicularis]|uniref:odorant receptor 131-2-like n=1 Tax=Sphaeramia orbicularis TaxID=375764 RepID=UPI00117EEAFB|nr:odorant receptor 131-2-like [Sphaeramia orbicularis]
MSYTVQSQNNTVGRGLIEKVISSTVTTLPCCVFFFINGIMLFTLRSKTVFRETCRYILLYNLLFADTVQLAFSQVMYLLAFRVRLAFPLCGVLIMLTILTTQISPLTLVVMSLERYVAVCYPLRHSTIVTVRNTAVAITVIWAFSLLNILMRVFLLLNVSPENLRSLQMEGFCSPQAINVNPVSEHYDKAYTYFVFVSAGVAVVASYVGVTIAARSASTDKTSARKAHKTLLLHLFQLSLSLISAMYNPIVAAISVGLGLDRVITMRIQIVLYMTVVMLPRCLSALIYGIRDKTIRPILMYYLCCQKKPTVISN